MAKGTPALPQHITEIHELLRWKPKTVKQINGYSYRLGFLRRKLLDEVHRIDARLGLPQTELVTPETADNMEEMLRRLKSICETLEENQAKSAAAGGSR
jgi:hypothetical protein